MEVSQVKSNRQGAQNDVFTITACAAGVLVSSFMMWGSIQANPSIRLSGSDGMTMNGPFAGLTMRMEFNGWSGSTTIAGLSSPNWLPVILAIAVAAIAWLNQSGAWKAPRLLMPVLSAVGLLLLASLLAVLVVSGEGTVGLGLVLATVLFVLLLRKSGRLMTS